MKGQPYYAINLEEAPCKYSFDKEHFSPIDSTLVKESCSSPNLNESESFGEYKILKMKKQ